MSFCFSFLEFTINISFSYDSSHERFWFELDFDLVRCGKYEIIVDFIKWFSKKRSFREKSLPDKFVKDWAWKTNRNQPIGYFRMKVRIEKVSPKRWVQNEGILSTWACLVRKSHEYSHLGFLYSALSVLKSFMLHEEMINVAIGAPILRVPSKYLQDTRMTTPCWRLKIQFPCGLISRTGCTLFISGLCVLTWK